MRIVLHGDILQSRDVKILVESHIPPEWTVIPAVPALERLIGRKQAHIRIGISNAPLWRWIKTGRFPALSCLSTGLLAAIPAKRSPDRGGVALASKSLRSGKT